MEKNCGFTKPMKALKSRLSLKSLIGRSSPALSRTYRQPNLDTNLFACSRHLSDTIPQLIEAHFTVVDLWYLIARLSPTKNITWSHAVQFLFSSWKKMFVFVVIISPGKTIYSPGKIASY